MNIDLQIYLCPDCFVPVNIAVSRDFTGEKDVQSNCPKCKREFMNEHDLIKVTQDTIGI